MNISKVAALLVLSGACFAVNAAAVNDIAVFSTAKSNGSISADGKDAYTKAFDVSLTNLSASKDFDLSKLCLKAYSPDKKEFQLEMIDAGLSQGTLKKGDSVKGMAEFSSEDHSIYNAALIKISDECK